ncbi:lipid A 3-O-deacylase PagL [Breznakibacter xylanolyticus]|uniref:Lipid A 3-O-deacylase PagL n=1 Tax=Breznakibacter xylanolyticus TaxID=990 RepID=A0A2W7PAN3_9BACT|nr:acyloxyacyl hydrolase [Breznakibacter xylanolyticus]PZX20362.1 lipid A 3-O-deacylase PagL [Breznakibacter xylanolyticus]
MLAQQHLPGNDSTRIQVTGRYHYGIVVPHHTSMTYLINDYSRGMEINITRKRYRQNLWETYLNKPETGIGLWVSSFGNANIYGNGFAVYPFINFRMFDAGRFSAKYRVALGLGYATKPFDVETNSYNTVFGSHLNAYVGLGALLNYRISKQLIINTTFSLNHLSNGSSKKPNNGINTATISLGTTWIPNASPEPVIAQQRAPLDNSREWIITGSIGRNQAAAYNPQRYWSGSLTINHVWFRKKTVAYTGGLDLIHFGGAPYANLKFQNMDENARYTMADNLYVGALAGAQALLGTTTLYVNTGVYLYKSTPPRQPVYARLGIRQQITPHLLGHFGIKANFFAAEFIEFGLGYRLKYRTNQHRHPST